MKFKCKCNHLIVDQTDFLPHKGYFIPDKEWFNFLDSIDEAVEKPGSSSENESELMKLREMAGRISKIAYQCTNCGRLYLSDSNGELIDFKLASDSGIYSIFDN